MSGEQITIDWLHEVAPGYWERCRRGLMLYGYSVNSIVSNGNYDDGPFVFSFCPSHDANMVPLVGQQPFITVAILECRDDALSLFEFLKHRKAKP